MFCDQSVEIRETPNGLEYRCRKLLHSIFNGVVVGYQDEWTAWIKVARQTENERNEESHEQ